MLSILKPAAAAILTIIVLDMIWIGFVMKSFYVRNMSEVGNVVGDSISPVYWSAGVVYLLLAIGIVYFVLPGTEAMDYLSIFVRGALLGLVIYGVYDFTNHSTLKSWPTVLAATDAVWGAFVCGAASVAASVSSKL